MKKYLTALVLTGGLAAAHANAACNYPAAPGKFPDGSQATKEEMLAAKKVVVQYNTDMDAYLACLQSEYDASIAAASNATADQKADMTKKRDAQYNDAVKEVTDVTDRFNEQLRAWKAKNQPEKKPS